MAIPASDFVGGGYEMVDDGSNGKEIEVNFQTASLQDLRHHGPLPIINWVTAEGVAGLITRDVSVCLRSEISNLDQNRLKLQTL